jgi:hypothetical protein
MRPTLDEATQGDRGTKSSILRVLADTHAAGLEEELRRLEQEQLAGSDHRAADHRAIECVRDLIDRRRRRVREFSMRHSTAILPVAGGDFG